jgi:hypothetical protein
MTTEFAYPGGPSFVVVEVDPGGWRHQLGARLSVSGRNLPALAGLVADAIRYELAKNSEPSR